MFDCKGNVTSLQRPHRQYTDVIAESKCEFGSAFICRAVRWPEARIHRPPPCKATGMATPSQAEVNLRPDEPIKTT